ncbi:MAG: glycosyltransferase family 4 protein [Candidatus Sedimenticola sp. (ex Thyasira tokunagai)]
MKVAYFINQYPKVSHSFIRREIMELEAQGVEVARYALRSDPDELVDSKDKSELDKTHYILQESPFYFFLSLIASFLVAPRNFIISILTAIKIGWNSDRGLIRHIFYFVEAAVLVRRMREAGAEHVHAHFGTNSAAVVMLAKLLGGPGYSFTVHGPEEFDKPQFLSLAEKIKHASFVVAISSYGRCQLYRWAAYDQWSKVKVVHCGLDSDFHSADQAHSEYNASPRFVCVGRLCEQKGQLLLVEAAGQLVRDGVDLELVLAGDGPMRAEIESLISQHDLKNHVRITGWISSDQVREELLAARAMVLPSFAEGLPVVIMEAMALSRPVISTYVAGIPELVQPGINGWLVAAGSMPKLAEVMRDALDRDADELKVMGSAARVRVLERHNISTEAGKLISHFREVLERPSR